jgi:hypothetical protein
VVKYVEAAELRDTSLLPVYLQSPPMPCSPHTTFQNPIPIWLPRWPAYMRKKN